MRSSLLKSGQDRLPSRSWKHLFFYCVLLIRNDQVNGWNTMRNFELLAQSAGLFLRSIARAVLWLITIMELKRTWGLSLVSPRFQRGSRHCYSNARGKSRYTIYQEMLLALNWLHPRPSQWRRICCVTLSQAKTGFPFHRSLAFTTSRIKKRIRFSSSRRKFIQGNSIYHQHESHHGYPSHNVSLCCSHCCWHWGSLHVRSIGWLDRMGHHQISHLQGQIGRESVGEDRSRRCGKPDKR